MELMFGYNLQTFSYEAYLTKDHEAPRFITSLSEAQILASPLPAATTMRNWESDIRKWIDRELAAGGR